MKQRTANLVGVLLTCALVSCDAGGQSGEPETGSPDPAGAQQSGVAATSPGAGGSAESAAQGRVVLPTGLAYTVLEEGQGESPQLGSTVLIHCTGRLPDGREFMNTRTAGVPKRETLGYDQLIEGVVDALLTMKPGERRQLHIPSELGYGSEGYPHVVPPRADLEMDLELVRVEP